MRKLLVLLVSLAVLVGCEQAATPLPVALQITNTPAPTSEIPQLRFAYSLDALVAFAGRERLMADAEVLVYDPQIDLQTPYDVVVVLGIQDDLTVTPEPITVSLILDRTQSPLDDPEVERLVRQAFDPTRMAAAFAYLDAVPVRGDAETSDAAQIRTELANAGYPDGLPLTLISDHVPASESLPELLRPFGFNIRLMPFEDTERGMSFPSGTAHAMITGSNPVWLAQIDAANVVDLYTVPISYRAGEGIALSFDPQGFPIPQTG